MRNIFARNRILAKKALGMAQGKIHTSTTDDQKLKDAEFKCVRGEEGDMYIGAAIADHAKALSPPQFDGRRFILAALFTLFRYDAEHMTLQKKISDGSFPKTLNYMIENPHDTAFSDKAAEDMNRSVVHTMQKSKRRIFLRETAWMLGSDKATQAWEMLCAADVAKFSTAPANGPA